MQSTDKTQSDHLHYESCQTPARSVKLPKPSLRRLFQTIAWNAQWTYMTSRLLLCNKTWWLLDIDFFLKIIVKKTFLVSNWSRGQWWPIAVDRKRLTFYFSHGRKNLCILAQISKYTLWQKWIWNRERIQLENSDLADFIGMLVLLLFICLLEKDRKKKTVVLVVFLLARKRRRNQWY